MARLITAASLATMLSAAQADVVATVSSSGEVYQGTTAELGNMAKEQIPIQGLNASTIVEGTVTSTNTDDDEDEEQYDEFDWDTEGPGSTVGIVQVVEKEHQKEFFELFEDDDLSPLEPEVLLAKIAETEKYMDTVKFDSKYDELVREYCLNYDPLCTTWAVMGECQSPEEESHQYMADFCAPACQSCDKLQVENLLEEEGPGSYIGVIQITDEETQKEELETYKEDYDEIKTFDEAVVLKKIADDEEYIEKVVDVEEQYEQVRFTCENKEPLCTVWALLGDCERQDDEVIQEYMTHVCAPACRTCDKFNPDYYEELEDDEDEDSLLEDDEDEEYIEMDVSA